MSSEHTALTRSCEGVLPLIYRRQEGKMAGHLPIPDADNKFQSIGDLRYNSLEVSGSNDIFRPSPVPGGARSCGQSPENVLSFRALKDRDDEGLVETKIPASSNIRVNPNRRKLNGYGSRAQSVDPGGGSYDSNTSMETGAPSEVTSLIQPKSSSYESISAGEDQTGLLDDDNIHESSSVRLSKVLLALNLWPMDRKRAFSVIKIGFLFTLTVVCCVVMLLQEETDKKVHFTILTINQPEILAQGMCDEGESLMRTTFRGSFYPDQRKGENFTQTFIYMNDENVMNLTVDPHELDEGDVISRKIDLDCHPGKNYTLKAISETRLPFDWTIEKLPQDTKHEVIFAFLILAFVYALIVFEIVHRTLAAQLGALAALAVLSHLNQRPPMEVIISWVDIETLTLLFGMMIIVAIFADTGFFDYSALQAYKLAKGQIWPLITLLCVFSAVVSAFLDNVTTILLMTPVTIKLCEVLNLDPKRILIAEVLFSNIGGTATAIGDPPNVIIVGALSSEGIGFSTFTMHMFPGIVLICFVGYGVLRLYYRDMNTLKNKDPPEIAEMKHEVSMWRRAAGRMTVFTREETLMRALFLQKAVEIEHVVYKTIHKNRRNEQQSFYTTMQKLKEEYYIKDMALLVKCGVVLSVVIVLLFTYSFIDALHADIGWIAVLGSILLLVLADVLDFEGILHKVEWATLLFFAALFILMEALSELGLINTIGDAIANLISTADMDSRLLVALILILWVSALASSFIDNIPYTTAMVPILQQLADKPELELPLTPMVVALAMGACLGGNGTLIGASCNVVCAGIADQHGYGFTFKEFFKIGFPMMLVTTATATVYVLICHCAFSWNGV